MSSENDVWKNLSRIDVSDHVEQKNNLTYLSWAWAWQTLKDNYPDATFTKHVNEYGHPLFSDKNGTGFVRVTVTAGNQSVTEVFPVLDYRNQAIADPTAMDVNTALQRGMTKAIGYLGLGAYIYAGEDLPPLPSKATIKADGKETEAEGADKIASIFLSFLPSMKTMDDLENFWRNNKTAIEILKAQSGDKYTDVLSKFTKRKEEISNGPASNNEKN